MIRHGINLALALGLLVSAAASAYAAATRFGISVDDVAQVLRSGGLNIDAAQVTLLAPVTASSAAPELRFVSAKKLNDTETAVKIACKSSAVCLPFYAVLHGAGLYERLPQPRASVKLSSQPPKAPCIRGGDHATLLMETADMRITVGVIALQAGSVGQTIRVTGIDRKRVYRAEVVGPKLVKGAL
jgi:hypothetical protein